MFKKIKLKKYKKVIENALIKRDVSQLNASMDTLAFVYNGDVVKDNSGLKKLANSLGVLDANLDILSFVTWTKNMPSLSQTQFCQKDISFRGLITNAATKTLVLKPIDVLVCFENKQHMHLDLITASSKAKFKVGFKGADPRFFDLILATEPTNFSLVQAELIKYFKILGKIPA